MVVCLYRLMFLAVVWLQLAMVVAGDDPSAINQPDKFAWQVFAEISTPVDPNNPDGPVTWETWALARDIFSNPNQAPVWPENDPLRNIERLEARPLQQVIFEVQSEGRFQQPASEIDRRTLRVDPVVLQRQGNETRMNRAGFDFVVAKELYYIEGQERFFNEGLKVDFPVEAREIKAQWRRLDDPSQHSRYHTAQVSNGGRIETWGLTALHITTKDLPNWFWATFEHTDNEGREGVVPSRDSFGLSSTDGPTAELLALFSQHKLGSKWHNYVLRGTQVDFVDSTGRPTILANSQVERGFQSSSSCITCHSRASIGPKPDQSFAVDNPQSPNDVSRLTVFESDEPLRGAIGTPDPAWFSDTSTTPVARKFTQLDFVWSLFRARRRVPFPQPSAPVVNPLPAQGAIRPETGPPLKRRLVELRAARSNSDTRVGLDFARSMRALRASGSQIEVTYNGFSPEAKASFQAAVDVWKSLLRSDVPIRINANWTPLGPGVLGSAGPATYSINFQGAPVANTWYPIALANKIAGTDLAPGEADIDCNFSSAFNNWYFGTDGNTPTNQYDLMSVVLHELGHGLGFTGTMTVEQSLGGWGGGTQFPVIYDRFGVNAGGQQLINTALFPNPSSALAAQLTSNQLFLNGSAAIAANGGTSPRIYAPSPFDVGSSFAHLDEATFAAGNINSLMTPQIGMSEAIHSPGPVGMAVLQDLGWTFTINANPNAITTACCGSNELPPQPATDLTLSDEEQVRLFDAAVKMATAVSDPKTPEFYRELNASVLRLKKALSTPIPSIADADISEHSAFAPLRPGTAADLDHRVSISDDPTFTENFARWIALPRRNRLRIWGGAPVTEGEGPASAKDLEHCVAVGANGRFCCTGTLVSRRVVVTAAHCFHLGCIGNRGEVYLGLNSNNPASGRVIKCKCIPHPEYDPATSRHDIAILILDEEAADVVPCPIATSSQIDSAFFLRLAGFGLTEAGRSGRKMTVELIVASPSCSSPSHQTTFGCNADREIVAGGNGFDSCNGDSGGPAYIEIDGKNLLAGATSRAAANSFQSCGDGGIYVRIDKELDWIQRVTDAENAPLALHPVLPEEVAGKTLP